MRSAFDGALFSRALSLITVADGCLRGVLDADSRLRGVVCTHHDAIVSALATAKQFQQRQLADESAARSSDEAGHDGDDDGASDATATVAAAGVDEGKGVEASAVALLLHVVDNTRAEAALRTQLADALAGMFVSVDTFACFCRPHLLSSPRVLNQQWSRALDVPPHCACNRPLYALFSQARPFSCSAWLAVATSTSRRGSRCTA